MKKIMFFSMILVLMTGCVPLDGYGYGYENRYGYEYRDIDRDRYEYDNYSVSQIHHVQKVYGGKIISVKPVRITVEKAYIHKDRHRAGAVTYAGAIIGGYIGHTVGVGPTKKVATATGIVAGALIGNAIENAGRRINGVELVVVLRDDSVIVIVQQGNANTFYRGQPVKVIKNGKSVRVFPS